MYEALLKKAKELWPMKSDLNPRTAREDAMIRIFCKLIDDALYAKRFFEVPRRGSEKSREGRALEVLEEYYQAGFDPDEDAHRVVMLVRQILKGEA